MDQAGSTPKRRDLAVIDATATAGMPSGLTVAVFMEGDNAHFLVVKGPLTLQLRIGGKGGTSADLPKLREAAKKAVPRV